MQRTRKVITRLLAVLAVVAAFIAIYLVVSGASTDDGNRSKNTPAKHHRKAKNKKTSKGGGGPGKATYVVEDGDTLINIAAKTGVSVHVLQTLNPSVDPQILSPGQRLKLR